MRQHRFSGRGAAFDFAGQLRVGPDANEVQVMVRVKVLGIAAVMAAGLSLVTSVNAAPLSFDPSEQTRSDAVVEFVAGGCGPGFHPNPWVSIGVQKGPRIGAQKGPISNLLRSASASAPA